VETSLEKSLYKILRGYFEKKIFILFLFFVYTPAKERDLVSSAQRMKKWYSSKPKNVEEDGASLMAKPAGILWQVARKGNFR
jgi:hypothetical protein